MSATVAERIASVRDRIVGMQLRGELNTPEKEERAAEAMRVAIRRSIGQRIVELVGEGVGILEACQISFRESGLKVTEEQVKTTARTFEANWDQFVKTAPVEIVSDAEFADILQGKKGQMLG